MTGGTAPTVDTFLKKGLKEKVPAATGAISENYIYKCAAIILRMSQ